MTKTYLSVPYIGCEKDEAGNETHPRCWAHFKWDGVPDRRRIKRAVRTWVRNALGRNIHCEELRMILKGRVRYEDEAVPAAGAPAT